MSYELTPERRSALRGIAADDRHAMTVLAADMLALLDAADERDRMAGELSDPSKLSILNGWLVLDVGRHNCGTDFGGHFGAHEPGCGIEPVVRLDTLDGWPGQP